VLTWTQTFGPQLATAARRHRRRLGRRWYVDEVFLFHGAVKTTATGQRFLEGFEAVHALRRGDVAMWCLAPGYRPQLATCGDRARALAAAMVTLAAGLNKAA
jgi:hypothetical protein